MTFSNANFWSILFGLLEIAGNLVGAFLIDRLGRKILLLISFGFMIISIFLMALFNILAIKNTI